MASRKEVEAFIVNYIKKLTKDQKNVDLYQDLFASMSEADFKQFMLDLKEGKKRLQIIVPHGDKAIKISLENNFALAKELKYDFFKKIKVKNHPDKPDHILPNKYLMLKLPICRLQQSLEKKISLPKGDKKVDLLTGQPTSDAKAARVSKQELEIMLGTGYSKSAIEFFTIRGGDLGAKDEFNKQLYHNGRVTQAQALSRSTGVEASKTLNAYLTSAHLRSTLLK